MTQFNNLTEMQYSIWLDASIQPGSSKYNLGGYADIKGSIDTIKFEKSINLLISSSENFRLRYSVANSTVKQSLIQFQYYPLEVLDFEKVPFPFQAAIEWMRKDMQIPFSLESENLFKFVLFKISSSQYLWFAKIHHLIIDGWSLAMMFKRTSEFYNQSNIPENSVLIYNSLEDFTLMSTQYLNSDVFLADRSFWSDKSKLWNDGGFDNFIVDRTVLSNINDFSTKSKSFELSRKQFSSLQTFSRNYNCSLFEFFIALYYMYFTNTYNKKSIVIGTPVLNRNNAAFKKTLGSFMNVLANIYSFSNDISFLELLKLIHAEIRESYRHSQYPFSLVQKEFNEQHKANVSIIDVLFSYENFDYGLRFDSHKSSIVALPNGRDNIPLTIKIREYSTNETIVFDLNYATEIFQDQHIDRLIDDLKFLMTSVINLPSHKLKDFDTLCPKSANGILERKGSEFVKDQRLSLLDLFYSNVLNLGSKLALICDGELITFKEIDLRSNLIAQEILKSGVGKDSIIPIFLDRSVNFFIALMGVLKMGGIYVPIDNETPVKKVQYIIDDTNPKLIIADNTTAFSKALQKKTLKILNLSKLDFKTLPENLTLEERQDLFCIIYTSGSTGNPKGVKIKMTSVLNRVLWMQKYYPFKSGERTALKTSVGFVDHLWEFFGPLLSGETSVLFLKPEILDLSIFFSKVQSQKISRLVLVPTLLKNILKELKNGTENLVNLKYWICSGEKLLNETVIDFYKVFQKSILINIYGSSEVTADALFWDTSLMNCEVDNSSAFSSSTRSVIGIPLTNTYRYVLGTNHQLLPAGVVGELFIGGVMVSDGYLNNKTMTKDFFIADPYSDNNQIIFKTGDLVRELDNGYLEYVGRTDNQVKINGNRVELQEVEAAISKIEGISQNIVSVRTVNGSAVLVAYIVFEKKNNIDSYFIRQILLNELPLYMIPSIYIAIDSMPLLESGKIDRLSLPKADITTRLPQLEEIAPSTPTEAILADIWSDILGCETFGIQSDFFELGGNSIKAIQILSAIKTRFGCAVSLNVILNFPTIFRLALYIDSINYQLDQESIVYDL